MDASTDSSADDCLLVSEKFVSVQGEGLSTGQPSAFLRLGKCNLSCSYCDTPYTWDSARFDLDSELQKDPLANVARWIVGNAPGRLIVTGGEPLLQKYRLERLLHLVDAASEPDESRVYVEIETNGTVTPTQNLLDRVEQWNVSPKLTNSGEPERRRLRSRPLETFSKCGTANFKFVVRGPGDVQEVLDLAARFGWERDRILLMPEAQDVETLRKRAPRVTALAAHARFRYSGRLHLELFGGGRGV